MRNDDSKPGARVSHLFIGKNVAELFDAALKTIKRQLHPEYKLRIKGEKGNRIQGRDTLKRVLKSEVVFRGANNTLIFEPGVTVKRCKIVFIGSDSTVVIGRNCLIKGRLSVTQGSTLLIGEGTSINGDGCFITCGEPSTRITLGPGCLLANPHIRTTDQHSIIDLETNTRINYAQDIVIEERVWLAEGAKVMKGVTIGAGSIVGAGAIVTQDLPANSLCVGVPARAVKANVSWRDELIYDDPFRY
ncbi:acyltransferase [Larsenimonas suaedae]|uniref:Acyltransferase n=1 Tax=Larsenimonas suaedae TaxID=1851019 RepID=A0ABU1GXK6_9GAMM|nr:acyltransferase [Larsenimonas suaedae]MCM2971524.1 acyltransferase [Larsenimonas suaedae]MDR5896780.1 acyltransferase [Larsenimonas suaedae]